MFEKRFSYIFLACSILLIGCSKGTEEKTASVDTSEPAIATEKDASDEVTDSISENQSEELGEENDLAEAVSTEDNEKAVLPKDICTPKIIEVKATDDACVT